MNNPQASENPQEPVWQYRGYSLRPSEFTTAMVHYYRAEIQRCNVWRSRLDATTNWAVVSTGAAISFSFASPDNHFSVIMINALLITVFLWIEARRYRYYELWSYRTRLLETDLFAAMLVPPFAPHADWAESLAESLLQPEFPISTMEAFGRRLRRNYIWIYFGLVLVTGLKNYLHPVTAVSWDQFIQRFAIGGLPGEIVLVAGFIFNFALLLIALLTIGLQQTSGEILPKFGSATEAIPGEPNMPQVPLFRKRRQFLVWIITDHPQEIARAVIKRMKRGVTSLPGTGMYTDKPHTVLIVAVTTTEVAELKSIVRNEDAKSFMIVIPARDVYGRGFQTFEKAKNHEK